jgi:hypothetical protein
MKSTRTDDLTRLREDFPDWWISRPRSSRRWHATRQGFPFPLRAGFTVVETETPELLRELLTLVGDLDAKYSEAKAEP